MDELTVKELIIKYPYLEEIAQYTLFISRDEVEKLRHSKKITLDGEEVSVEFLKKVLTDNSYYNYALNYFENKSKSFNVAYIINGDTGGILHYNKSTIINGIEKLISDGELSLENNEQEKLEKLKDIISFNKFLLKYGEKNYHITIDGNKYEIPVKKLISLLDSSEQQFDLVCNSNDVIDGIPSNHLVYAAFCFFKKNKVDEEYLLSKQITKHLKDINSLQKVDFQAINRHLETTDTKYQNVVINDELEKLILSGMPEDGSDLEKALYIYIKMCKVLTYDDEYYAVNQVGRATEKHKNVDYVATITPENNKVVCFEFNLIYAKLLNKLGINFSSNYKGMVGEAYGEAHANLEFRSGKFLVNADSVTSILSGDIVRAKTNQPLEGINCINVNEQTKQEFMKTLDKMYHLIINQEKSNFKSLDQLLAEYTTVTRNMREVDFEEKMAVIIEKVNATNMVGIDALSHIMQLEKIIFTKEQRENNVGLTIIRNNQPIDSSKQAMASIVFTFNALGFKDHPEKNRYYCFNPMGKLEEITNDSLQANFNDHVFEYVDKDDPKIPGIYDDNRGVKR